jgi:hypothetical protein
MKIAIVGSRDYKNLQKVIDLVNQLPNDSIVVSGGARGVDRTAELAAKKRGLTVDSKPAKWNDISHPDSLIRLDRFGGKYDARAGLRRNKDIMGEADEVYAFWDGLSPGTKDSINYAKKLNKKITIISDA